MEKQHKELLKTLHLNWIRESTPGAFEASGGYSMKIKPFRDDTANGLSGCIETFVRGQHQYFNRINTTGLMRKIGGKMKWTKGNSNKGAADTRIVFKGKSIDVETKIGRDVMSPAQIREKVRVEKAGGFYIVATSFAQFLEEWKSLGFTIPEISNIGTHG